MKTARHIQPIRETTRKPALPRARVVYTQAPVLLGTLISEGANGWRIRLGRDERVIGVDPSVDPALLSEARANGARVVIDASASPVIAGVLQTARSLRVNRDGAVDAQLKRFSIQVQTEAVIKTFSAFLQLKEGELELYGERVLSRAREVAKILARMIQLN